MKEKTKRALIFGAPFLMLLVGLYSLNSLVYGVHSFIALMMWTLGVVLITWLYLDLRYYDAESQIKRLQKVVGEWAPTLQKSATDTALFNSMLPIRKRIEKIEVLIKALQEFHFPKSNDGR